MEANMESSATPGPWDFEDYPSLSRVKGKSKGGSERDLNEIQGLGHQWWREDILHVTNKVNVRAGT